MRTSSRLAVVGLLVLLPTLTSAQNRWSWPEEPENIQVLGEDVGGAQLGSVMRGFATSLGVRCHHCHVGEEGVPFSEWDFASDEKPEKATARLMLRMMKTINQDYLADVPREDGVEPVNFWCHSCHAGRPRPATLVEELRTKTEEGVDAVLAHYRDLRERYYGRGAYDFGEASLNQIGYQFLQGGDVEAAIRVFELNAEHFEDSANVYDSLAEAYVAHGEKERARELYRKSLELNPRNVNAQKMLEQLEAEGER